MNRETRALAVIRVARTSGYNKHHFGNEVDLLPGKKKKRAVMLSMNNGELVCTFSALKGDKEA